MALRRGHRSGSAALGGRPDSVRLEHGFSIGEPEWNLRCHIRSNPLSGCSHSTAPPGSLGQVEIPGAGSKHGEVIVLTPEQRRAADDALAGYLASYEASWRAGHVDELLSLSRLANADARRERTPVDA